MLVIKAMMRSGHIKTTTTKTIEFVPEHNELILSDNGCSCQSCSDRSIMLSNEDIYLPCGPNDKAPLNPNVAGLIFVMNEQGQTVDKIYPVPQQPKTGE